MAKEVLLAEPALNANVPEYVFVVLSPVASSSSVSVT
jgi:hypothetical protein